MKNAALKIGTTQTGKAIYFSMNAGEYTGFTKADHLDACDIHSTYAFKSEGASKVASRKRAIQHNNIAKYL